MPHTAEATNILVHCITTPLCKRILWTPKPRIANYGDVGFDSVQWKCSIMTTATTHDNVDINKCVVKLLGWLYSDHEEQKFVLFSSYVA